LHSGQRKRERLSNIKRSESTWYPTAPMGYQLCILMNRTLPAILLAIGCLVFFILPANADQEAIDALAGVWRLKAAYNNERFGQIAAFGDITLSKNGHFYMGKIEVEYDLDPIPEHLGEYQMYWFVRGTQDRGPTIKVFFNGETLLLHNGEPGFLEKKDLNSSWLFRRLAPIEEKVHRSSTEEPITFEKTK